MKSIRFTKRASEWCILMGALGVAGCATPGGGNSGNSVPGNDPSMMANAAEQLKANSESVRAAMDDARSSLERRQARQPSLPSAIAPERDPFEDKLVSIDMYEAKAEQFLWAIAKELGANMVIEPRILKSNQKASLYLNQVSAREAMNAIVKMFDLSANITGNNINVSSTEQRVFPADLLGARVGLNVLTGGDVLGGGEKESLQSLRGTLRITGDVGYKDDAFDTLLKSVEAIVSDPNAKPDDDDAGKPTVSLDRRSQSLFVRARPSRMRSVAEFLAQANAVRNRQVQIDMQLVDVTLSQNYQLGIDWGILGKSIAGSIGPTQWQFDAANAVMPKSTTLPNRTILIPSQPVNPGKGGIGLAASSEHVTAVLNALRTFGSVKLVSNPTIRARSGEPSYVSVGTNYRYISKVSATTTTVGSGVIVTSDAETTALFSGVMVGITPSVRRDGTIEMFVQPMQSTVRQDSLKLVPVGSNASVTLPVIDSKSVTTTLAVNSGDVVVIGGLADETTSRDNGGVPGASDVPILGNLFDQRANSQTSRELVVVMKATLL